MPIDTAKLDEFFPRYEEHNPLVPVWCLTPGLERCMHRFFDTSAISPSGRFLATLQFPFEDRKPDAGEKATVLLVDLLTGENRVVAETAGWEPQMGANINWGATDDQLFFNDVDTETWIPFSWKYSAVTGEKQRMQGAVYHASADGKWLISANLGAMRRTQMGYGVILPDGKVRRNIGPAEDDGFYLTSTESGECHLFLPFRELIYQANPAPRFEDPDKLEIYGFHSKFNAQCTRVLMSLRAFPAQEYVMWNAFSDPNVEVSFAWMTANLERTEIHCAAGPEVYAPGGHHGTWHPDGWRITSNLKMHHEGMRFYCFNCDGSERQPLLKNVLGSGHPSVHADGKFIITDSYLGERVAFGDGTVPLRWVNLENGDEKCAIRINTSQPCPDNTLRVDPHPAWDRSNRFVVFNGYVDGSRRVFLADMASLFD